MHSTATEVGTLVDGKNRLAKMLVKFKFQHEQREVSADEGKIRSCKRKARVELYARSDGCSKTEPRNGNEDTEI